MGKKGRSKEVQREQGRGIWGGEERKKGQVKGGKENTEKDSRVNPEAGEAEEDEEE